jgi:hypothetical protein
VTTARSESGGAALPDAAAVVAKVNTRNRGSSMVQHFTITLSDRSGSSRERGMSVFRRTTDDEEQTALFFTSPASIDGTALLVRDYREPGRDDGLWLYLPAMRTVRRISLGSRGQEFFGTDFSLLEVSTDTELRDDLLDFRVTGRGDLDGTECLLLEGIPNHADLRREVGYSRAEYWVDESMWMPRRVVLHDASGKALKEVRFDGVREEGGVWTVQRRSAESLASGHRTVFTTTGVELDVEMPDSLFTEAGLSRGPPRNLRRKTAPQ